MERAEAEAVYEQGRETVVAVLLEFSAQNALLRREVADLRERVAQQEERIAELERRLNRNSRNSSLPPSQDPPAAPERRQAPPSGRGRGCGRARSARASRRPSPPSQYAIASRAAIPQSSFASSSAPSSRAVPSRPSSAARAPLWRRPTKTCSGTCAARRPSTCL